MKQKEKFYDVYVSYPPNVDRERINACLFDNLPEHEAEDLVNALLERPQAIIAENCTQAERENAQHYFNYLGLDVIVRQSLELAQNSAQSATEGETAKPAVHQCPVCMYIIEDPEDTECKVCSFHFNTKSEQIIQRKRIEWQEKLSFEHKMQTEIEHKLQMEKEKEEKHLRKQIRAELEEKLRKEMGENSALKSLTGKKKHILIGMLAAFSMIVLVAIGYLAAKYL